MHKGRLVLLVLIIMLVVTGCFAGRQDNEVLDVNNSNLEEDYYIADKAEPGIAKEYILKIYLTDTREEYIFPVSFFKMTDKPLETVLELLLDWPYQQWSLSPMAANIELLSFKVEDRLAVLDLNTEPGKFYETPMKEARAIEAIVLTLSQFLEIDGVKLLVNGEPYKESVYFPTDGMNNHIYSVAVNQDKIKLWFGDENFMYLVPVSKSIETGVTVSGDELALTVAEELLKGNGYASSLVRTFPENVRILSLEVDYGTAYLNLSKDFVDNHWGTSAGEWVTLNSITYSLTELEEIRRVQLLIEGEKVDFALGNIRTDIPLERGLVNLVSI